MSICQNANILSNNNQIDNNKSNSFNFLKGSFTHRTNNNYNLLNELQVMKAESYYGKTSNQKSLFKATGKKSQSQEKFSFEPIMPIEKKRKSKDVPSIEKNLNEEKCKLESLNNCILKPKKIFRRNNPLSINKQQNEGEKEFKLLYNSIDYKKEDIKKYWTNKKNKPDQMNFVSINSKTNNKQNQYTKKRHSSSLAISTNELFKILKFHRENDIENDLENGKVKNNSKKISSKPKTRYNCNEKGKKAYNMVKVTKYDKSSPELDEKSFSITDLLISSKNLIRQPNNTILSLSNENEPTIEQESVKSENSFQNSNNRGQLFEEDLKSANDEEPTNINSNIDDEYDIELLDNEDEKISPLSHLPIFASKKLSYYYTPQITQPQIFEYLSDIRDFNCINQFLCTEDLISLSLVNLFFEKRTMNTRYKLIFSRVLNHYGNQRNLEADHIWNNLRKFSKLSNEKYLKKIYLDNAYKPSPCILDIKKDIIRTYPNDSSFSEKCPQYKRLQFILNAYANYNPKIGYAQGMNFLASKILKRCNKEEETFIYLDAIISKLNMEAIFGVSNQLSTRMNYLGKLIHDYIPCFDEYLKERSLGHEVFTANWIITLFASSTYDEELQIIWDFIFIFGWDFIYYFIISIIITFQGRIFKFNFDYFCEQLSHLLNNDHFKREFRYIIGLTCNYLLSRDKRN